MRSRSSSLLLLLTTLVVTALVWLAPKAAFASDASYSASFAASFAPAPAPVPAPSVLERLARFAPTDRAPLCDPRGATTFAPPPQMQDVEVSLDSGLTLEECLASLGRNSHDDVKRAAPGRAPPPLAASGVSSDAAVLATRVMLAACARELLPVPVASTSCPRPGIRSTVDRPPRA